MIFISCKITAGYFCIVTWSIIDRRNTKFPIVLSRVWQSHTFLPNSANHRATQWYDVYFLKYQNGMSPMYSWLCGYYFQIENRIYLGNGDKFNIVLDNVQSSAHQMSNIHFLYSALVRILWNIIVTALIARLMGPTWGPYGADRTQMGPTLAPWTLLSGQLCYKILNQLATRKQHHN